MRHHKGSEASNIGPVRRVLRGVFFLAAAPVFIRDRSDHVAVHALSRGSSGSAGPQGKFGKHGFGCRGRRGSGGQEGDQVPRRRRGRVARLGHAKGGALDAPPLLRTLPT